MTQPAPESQNAAATNGAHATTPPTDAWQDPGALMWSLWTEPERLELILDNPVTELWYQRTPCDYLATLANFRSVPAEWGRIWERFKSLGGKPTLLETAITDLLRDAQTPRASADAPGPAPLPSLADAIVSYTELQTLEIPKREVYLDWLPERALVMVYGPRGVGKTMTMLGLAVSLTTGQPFLKWAVQRPTGVLYVEGEMSVDELRDRVTLMTGGTEPACLAFLPSELVQSRLERDLTLVAATAREEIDAILAARPAMRVLVLDNISCLFPGISEDKKQDWEPANQWLIRLRHRGITVILGHHAGKGGRQRGTSGREDALNTVLALSLPPGYKPEDGYHFYLRFEKSRGLKGPTVEGLDVRFDETPGWTYQTLEVDRTERLKLMLADGVPPRIIAEELGISASYVYRQKRYLGL
jgi:putative DNA primase/helicase